MSEGPTPPELPAEANIAGVKLSPTGRTLECDAGRLKLERGVAVVIEDGQALAVATVSVRSVPRPARAGLWRVLRVADERDIARRDAALARGAESLAVARDRVRALALPIKMFRCEITQGGGKGTFYFSSENRIDFRDLVHDLGARLRLRIELRQVGVRDEAKMVGGIGSCGRELCCTTFLPHFAPISIKAAKNQNLVLNPTKVSGQCGRLKCCLIYEEAAYIEAGKKLPRIGRSVDTPQGPGRVGDLDVLAGRVRVYFEHQPPRVFTADEIRASAPPGGGTPAPEPDEPPSGVPKN